MRQIRKITRTCKSADVPLDLRTPSGRLLPY
jgi:hypothetical protein